MKIQICTGKSCLGKFSKYIMTRLQNDMKFHKWKDIEIEESCCMGECRKSPNIKIDAEKHHYIQGSKASQLVANKLLGSENISKKTKK